MENYSLLCNGRTEIILFLTQGLSHFHPVIWNFQLDNLSNQRPKKILQRNLQD